MPTDTRHAADDVLEILVAQPEIPQPGQSPECDGELVQQEPTTALSVPRTSATTAASGSKFR